jgi:hypothetical protein
VRLYEVRVTLAVAGLLLLVVRHVDEVVVMYRIVVRSPG